VNPSIQANIGPFALMLTALGSIIGTADIYRRPFNRLMN